MSADGKLPASLGATALDGQPSNVSSEDKNDIVSDSTREQKKKSLRKVSFPDEESLVTQYFEPANPWQDVPSTTRAQLAAEYLESCRMHNTPPIDSVLQQIRELPENCIGGGVRAPRLALCECSLGGTAPADALEAVLRKVQFRRLEIHRVHMDDEGAEAIFDMLEYYESAATLCISGPRQYGIRGWQAASRMIKKSAELSELELADSPLEAAHAPVLARSLRPLTCRLRALSLHRVDLAGEPLLCLVIALKSNSSVRELRLGDNRLTATDASQLGSLLRYNTKIQLLDLSNNQIQDTGVGHIAEALVNQAAQTPPSAAASPLSPHHIPLVGYEARGLAFLILWNNQLTRNCAQHLAKVLRSSHSLCVLNVGRNALGAEGVRALAAGGAPSWGALASLGLQAARLAADAAKPLAALVRAHTALQRLDLRDNRLGLDGLQAIYNAMKDNKTLTQIDLDETTEWSGACARLVREIRSQCRRNEPPAPAPPAAARLHRKISLTCHTAAATASLKPSPSAGQSAGCSEEDRRSRLRSPAPSPAPSPAGSPVPAQHAHSRFYVSRVTPERESSTDSSCSSPSTPTRPAYCPAASRFKVVQVAEPPPQIQVHPAATPSRSRFSVTRNYDITYNPTPIPRPDSSMSDPGVISDTDVSTPDSVRSDSELVVSRFTCQPVLESNLPAPRFIVSRSEFDTVTNIYEGARGSTGLVYDAARSTGSIEGSGSSQEVSGSSQSAAHANVAVTSAKSRFTVSKPESDFSTTVTITDRVIYDEPAKNVPESSSSSAVSVNTEGVNATGSRFTVEKINTDSTENTNVISTGNRFTVEKTDIRSLFKSDTIVTAGVSDAGTVNVPAFESANRSSVSDISSVESGLAAIDTMPVTSVHDISKDSDVSTIEPSIPISTSDVLRNEPESGILNIGTDMTKTVGITTGVGSGVPISNAPVEHTSIDSGIPSSIESDILRGDKDGVLVKDISGAVIETDKSKKIDPGTISNVIVEKTTNIGTGMIINEIVDKSASIDPGTLSDVSVTAVSTSDMLVSGEPRSLNKTLGTELEYVNVDSSESEPRTDRTLIQSIATNPPKTDTDAANTGVKSNDMEPEVSQIYSPQSVQIKETIIPVNVLKEEGDQKQTDKAANVIDETDKGAVAGVEPSGVASKSDDKTDISDVSCGFKGKADTSVASDNNIALTSEVNIDSGDKCKTVRVSVDKVSDAAVMQAARNSGSYKDKSDKLSHNEVVSRVSDDTVLKTETKLVKSSVEAKDREILDVEVEVTVRRETVNSVKDTAKVHCDQNVCNKVSDVNIGNVCGGKREAVALKQIEEITENLGNLIQEMHDLTAKTRKQETTQTIDNRVDTFNIVPGSVGRDNVVLKKNKSESSLDSPDLEVSRLMKRKPDSAFCDSSSSLEISGSSMESLNADSRTKQAVPTSEESDIELDRRREHLSTTSSIESASEVTPVNNLNMSVSSNESVSPIIFGGKKIHGSLSSLEASVSSLESAKQEKAMVTSADSGIEYSLQNPAENKEDNSSNEGTLTHNSSLKETVKKEGFQETLTPSPKRTASLLDVPALKNKGLERMRKISWVAPSPSFHVPKPEQDRVEIKLQTSLEKLMSLFQHPSSLFSRGSQSDDEKKSASNTPPRKDSSLTSSFWSWGSSTEKSEKDDKEDRDSLSEATDSTLSERVQVSFVDESFSKKLDSKTPSTDTDNTLSEFQTFPQNNDEPEPSRSVKVTDTTTDDNLVQKCLVLSVKSVDSASSASKDLPGACDITDLIEPNDLNKSVYELPNAPAGDANRPTDVAVDKTLEIKLDEKIEPVRPRSFAAVLKSSDSENSLDKQASPDTGQPVDKLPSKVIRGIKENISPENTLISSMSNTKALALELEKQVKPAVNALWDVKTSLAEKSELKPDENKAQSDLAPIATIEETCDETADDCIQLAYIDDVKIVDPTDRNSQEPEKSLVLENVDLGKDALSYLIYENQDFEPEVEHLVANVKAEQGSLAQELKEAEIKEMLDLSPELIIDEALEVPEMFALDLKGMIASAIPERAKIKKSNSLEDLSNRQEVEEKESPKAKTIAFQVPESTTPRDIPERRTKLRSRSGSSPKSLPESLNKPSPLSKMETILSKKKKKVSSLGKMARDSLLALNMSDEEIAEFRRSYKLTSVESLRSLESVSEDANSQSGTSIDSRCRACLRLSQESLMSLDSITEDCRCLEDCDKRAGQSNR